MIIGKDNKLQFDVVLSRRDHALARGSLRAFIGKYSIWSDEQQQRGISWTWIDLLDHLARAWPFLKYEEGTPLGVIKPLELLRDGRVAQTEYDFEPTTPECTKEAYIFVRRHNLATGIDGLYLPPLSLLREGKSMWVVSTVVTKLLNAEETLQTVAELGDALAAHAVSGDPDDRSQMAVAAWRNREPQTESRFLIKLGSMGPLRDIVPQNQTLASYLEADVANDIESSLLIAARMSESVPLEIRRAIIEALRDLPAKGITRLLADLSEQAQAVIPNFAHRAHDQGAKLAQWARKTFGFAPDVKADAQGVLRQLGVDVRMHHFGTDTIDAVGCWGHNHGPAILVNLDGEHAQADAGRRTTFAHELAHVLFDREGSLPAAEILGGNAPRYPEQRANAFAAEFLLPKSTAVDRIKNAAVDEQVGTIKRIRIHFDVSQEVAAWQILNSPARHLLNPEALDLVNGWAKVGRRRDLWSPDS
jgi:hypothetical protein